MLSWNDKPEHKTWTALFLKLLVKTSFLPISIKEEKIIFKIFSVKTIFHLLVSFCYFIISNILLLMFASTGFYKILAGAGSYELVSLVLMSMSMITGLFIPILLSSGLTSLSPDTILRNDLRSSQKSLQDYYWFV